MSGGLVYGSVCSGIEAASVAWHPFGWRAAFVSDIDPFARAVLAHRFPDVPLRGDFTEIQAGDHEPIDLLVGGTPCQSFSVAGLRGGLDDERGNLALGFLRLAQRLRPRWLVWENVPGVLSIDEGRAFGAILGGMVELGYGFAYRVLDAQFVRVDGLERAVPQRRRRVFVVGHLGDWRPAAAVLFNAEGMRGDSPPRREAGQGASARVAGSLNSSIGRGTGGAHETDFLTAFNARQDPDSWAGCTGPLDADGYTQAVAYGGNRTSGPIDVAPACNAHPSGSRRLDFESEPFVVACPVADSLTVGANQTSGFVGDFVAHALRADGFDASEDGTGRGTPLVPVAFAENSRAEVRLCGGDGTVAAQLTTGGGKPGQGFPAIAFQERGREGGRSLEIGGEVAFALTSPTGGSRAQERNIAQGYAVRRLTPRECERLQGFPDDFTLVPYRGKPASDGPRYRAIGNSMAVNVMRWIGGRIDRARALTARAA